MEDNINAVGEKEKDYGIGTLVDVGSKQVIDNNLFTAPKPIFEKTEYDIGTVVDPLQNTALDKRAVMDNIIHNYDVDNKKFAQAVDIAKKTGADPYSVYDNFPAHKKKVELDAIDLENLKRDAPFTYRMLADTTLAGMTTDQIPQLSTLEKITYNAKRFSSDAVKFAESVGNEYTSYDKLVDTSNLIVGNLFEQGGLDNLSDEQKLAIDDYTNSGVAPLENTTFIGDAVRGMVSQIPIITDVIKNAGIPAAGIAAGGAVLSVLAPEASPAIVAGTRTAIGLVGRGGLYKTSFTIEAASTAIDLMQMRKQYGLQIDNETIRLASLGVGVVSAALEQMPLGMIGKAAGELLKSGRISKLILKRALKDKTLMTKLLSLGASTSKIGLAEGGTEVAQEIVHMIGETAAVNAKDGDFSNVTFDQLINTISSDTGVKRMSDSFYSAFATSFGFGALGVPVIIADTAKVKSNTARENAILDQVREASSNVPLREASPDTFRGFAQEAGMKDEYVYIDGDAISDYMDTIEPKEGDKAYQILSDAYNTVQKGEDVKIPLADFATYIVNTEHDTALSQNMRMSEDGISIAKQKDYELMSNDQLRKIIEKEARNLNDTEQVQYDNIVKEMKNKIKLLGTYTSQQAEIMASVYGNYIARVAKANNESIEDVAKRFNLDVTSDIKKREEQILDFGVPLNQDFGDATITELKTLENGDKIRVNSRVNDLWKTYTESLSVASILKNCANG